MNAVERLLYYADNIDQEREVEENGSVSEKWLQKGEIEFSDVMMSHRPGLPLALKGVNLKIKEGEHVGIVGRTGAGKSSIVAALFGMTELESGTITIDGVDTSRVSLQKLRDGLSSTFIGFPWLWGFSHHPIVIPQDPLLFSGTIRSNLDPFGVHDDVTLYGALRAACLVDPADAEEETIVSSDTCEITLDTTIEEEGLNLSLGQVRPFVTVNPELNLTTVESYSDVSWGWPVPWLRIQKSSFWTRRLVRESLL